MPRQLVKARVMPAHIERADSLRHCWSYHAPDGPYPTRNLVLASALTKGLRGFDLQVVCGVIPDVALPSSCLTRHYPRVRFDRSLLAFADRLRGPLYELRCQSVELASIPSVTYPSRAYVLYRSLQVGLDEVARLYPRLSTMPQTLQAL